jgi:hypothetical protein
MSSVYICELLLNLGSSRIELARGGYKLGSVANGVIHPFGDGLGYLLLLVEEGPNFHSLIVSRSYYMRLSCSAASPGCCGEPRC